MVKKDYNAWSKDDLIAEIKNLRKRKKYGLVWEDKPEDVVEQCKIELPVLEEVKSLAITTDDSKPTNILIEGDNYHALSVLNYTHKGKIDVIYIDPPYNRGGDFRYNDNYVEKEDAYRHSKWLSFLYKRLQIAKKLLRNPSVLFVSIDDNEQAQLRLLLNEIFGEDNVDVMVWRKSGDGRDGKMKNTTTFRKDHEYVLVCFKGVKKLNKIRELPAFQNEYGNSDDDPRGAYKAGSISRREDASDQNHGNFYTVVSPSGRKITRQFDVDKTKFDKLNSDIEINVAGKKVSRIYWGKKGDAVPSVKIFVNEERSVTPYSVLLTKGTTTEGTKEVSQILGKDCKTMRPKPIDLIKTLIQLADKRDDLTVLDFFAGTGTAGHATMQYSLERKRNNIRFILCTDNTEEICTKYCYPRIRKMMKGGYKDKKNRKIQPLFSNLKYFKTTFVPAESTDKNKTILTQKASAMLCLKEGTFERVKVTARFQIFRNKEHHTGIILDQRAIGAFKKAIAKKDGKFNVYVFSLSDDIFEDEFEDVKDKVSLSPIPYEILHAYRQIHKRR